MRLHFSNDVANDAESTQKLIIKSETTCKLINRIPGLLLLISCLPGSALRTEPCLVNLISKDSHLVFSIYHIFGTLFAVITKNLHMR